MLKLSLCDKTLNMFGGKFMYNKATINTDVLVLGSGPSGFAAAYSAAKNGAKVILVEQGGDIGGISTSGLMSHWTGTCGSPLYYELINRSVKKNDFKCERDTVIDPEKCKNCGMCAQVCPYQAIQRIIVPCENACTGDVQGRRVGGHCFERKALRVQQS